MPTDHQLKTTTDIKTIQYRLQKTKSKYKRYQVDDNGFDEYIQGIPYGLTIMYGEPGTGKSQMAAYIANMAVRKNFNVLYVFSESSIDTERLNPSVVTADFTAYLPRWEKVIDQIYALLNYTKADILILDSITKLFSETSKAVEEADLRDALSTIKKDLHGAIPIVGISQIRGSGQFSYPAGGRAIDHESDLLINFEKIRYRNILGKIKKSAVNEIYTIFVEKDKHGLAYQKSALQVNYIQTRNEPKLELKILEEI
jgi:predicted ATP-dependent serine protease